MLRERLSGWHHCDRSLYVCPTIRRAQAEIKPTTVVVMVSFRVVLQPCVALLAVMAPNRGQGVQEGTKRTDCNCFFKMLIWFKEYTASHVMDNCHAKMKLHLDIKFNLGEILLATMTILCHTAVT